MATGQVVTRNGKQFYQDDRGNYYNVDASGNIQFPNGNKAAYPWVTATNINQLPAQAPAAAPAPAPAAGAAAAPTATTATPNSVFTQGGKQFYRDTKGNNFAVDPSGNIVFPNGNAGAYPWVQVKNISEVNTPAQQQYAGGVSPVGVVEPFNDWQKMGLTDLAGGASAGDPFYGKVGGYLDKAAAGLEASTGALTPEALSAGIAKYKSPFTQNVIDSSISTLSQEADKARARIKSAQAGSLTPNSSSAGTQFAELDKSYLDQVGKVTAGLNYQANEDALSNFFAERGQAATGAGGMAELANMGINLGGAFDARQLGNVKNKIAAGTAVQAQNQNLLNAANAQIPGLMDYDKMQLNDLMRYLGAFQGTNYSTPEWQYPTSTGDKLSGLGGILSSEKTQGLWDSVFR